ncbi:MAG: winged helix-turn-helix transcriptional regulator, partial [Planctomycetes bacterium]|nr:winged helix-turn-helix transcriptional regulator [Planctomycetota bacterium]
MIYAGAMRLSRLQIERELRRRIQARIYPPGSCLPSRRALQQELGGSPLTIQAAFDQLVQQGYAVPHGTQGTFVAEHLPNESTVALVFNDGYETGTWNRFYSALSRIAADPVRLDGPPAATTAFRPYCLIGGRPEGEAYERLCADLADGALAGMLFTNPPLLSASSPVLTADVPRVCIDNVALGGHPFTTSHLRICDQPVLAALFGRLRGHGRARIAGLAGDPGNLDRYRTLAAAHGLE